MCVGVREHEGRLYMHPLVWINTPLELMRPK